MKQLVPVLPILLLLAWEVTPAAEAEDSCVDCHSDRRFLVTNKKLYAYFQEWQFSIHKQEEVSCSDCHGGNPKVPDKDGAHGRDVAESRKASAVNFRNIPATCGQCHDDYLKAYRQSPHFEHLIAKKQEEQGPNCVTCHGSINAAVLNINTVQQACARCHNEETDNHPEIPKEAETILNRFLSIHRFYRYITARAEPGTAQQFFKKADAQIRSLSVGWHGFDLEEIQEKTQSVLRLLKDKRKEVRSRSRNAQQD